MTSPPSHHRAWQAALLVPWALLTWRFWFLCDDAYITFRYALNLVRGHGLVFNVGEWPPVEGYSNLLWLLLAAAFQALSIPVEAVAAVSALSGAALILRVHRALVTRLGHDPRTAFAATLPLALSPVIGVWSTSGLETMPFALAVFLVFEAIVLAHQPRPVLAAVAAAAVVLIRTEGWLWIGVFAVLGALVHARTRHTIPRAALLATVAPPLVVILLHAAFRIGYYGTLVPNTALVKVGVGPDLLLRGIKYVLLFALTTLVPALSLLGARRAVREHGVRGAVIALIPVGFFAYGALVGGDFMPFGRLLLPAMPFTALLLADLLSDLPRPAFQPAAAVAALLAVLPAFDLHLAPEPLRAALHFRLSDENYLSEYGKWDNMLGNTEGFMRRGKALAAIAAPGDAVVSGAVGAMAFAAPDLWVWDQYGVITKEVASRPFHDGALREAPGHDKKVEAEFFAKYAPRFLYARSVKGKNAANHMRDSIFRWEVDPLVTDQYVPDFVEVDVGEDERTFLLMVRRRTLGEDPAAQWNRFEDQRRKLHAELKEQYGEATDAADDGNG